MKDILGAVGSVAEATQCMEKTGYNVVYIMKPAHRIFWNGSQRGI
jgi:hypothetical protein